MLHFDNICPQIRTSEDGPFGKIFEDDKGFSDIEWASIPPIPNSMRGITFNEFNAALKAALENLLLTCNFSSLTKEQSKIIAILYDGYSCWKWVPDENGCEIKKEYSCQDIAINNWLDETNQKYWSRLNWDIIETSFPKRSEEWIAEEEKWAKEVGVTFKKNWEYEKPEARWSYWGEGYYGAAWSVRNNRFSIGGEE